MRSLVIAVNYKTDDHAAQLARSLAGYSDQDVSAVFVDNSERDSRVFTSAPAFLNLGGGFFGEMPESMQHTAKIKPPDFNQYAETICDLLSPELILSEHVRLGSSQVILSRDYNQIFDECGEDLTLDVFRREIEKLQGCIKQMRRLGSQIQAANSRKLKCAVDEIVRMRSNGLNTAVGGYRFPARSEDPIVERL